VTGDDIEDLIRLAMSGMPFEYGASWTIHDSGDIAGLVQPDGGMDIVVTIAAEDLAAADDKAKFIADKVLAGRRPN
jgi:hypothetical protein